MDGEQDTTEPGDHAHREPAEAGFSREGAHAYTTRADEPRLRIVGRGQDREPGRRGKGARKVKTSVYLERSDVDRLAWLADVEGRPQAEVIRDAIRAYSPRRHERRFQFFDSGEGDGTSVTEIPGEEVMRGFGADAWDDGEEPVGDLDR